MLDLSLKFGYTGAKERQRRSLYAAPGKAAAPELRYGKSIRNKTGLTQVLFAKFMGVSVKTVEAWEAGRNHPEGTACRLLSMTRSDPSFPLKSGIVTASVK